MAEPSIVEYARHFGLTVDHMKTDVLDHLDLADTAVRNENNDIAKDCTDLFSFFTDANVRVMQEMNNRPLQVSHDSLHYLETCCTPKRTDAKQAYRDLLPDHRRLNDFKFSIPWLNHGDPVKDSQKIRKAINLDTAIDDLLDDFNESSNGTQWNELLSPNYGAELLTILRQHAIKGSERDSLRVSKKTLQYLHDVTSVTLPFTTRKHLLENFCPYNSQTKPLITRNLLEDDLVVDAEEDSSECDELKEDSNTIAVERDEEIPSISETDFLSHLDATIDTQLGQNLDSWPEQANSRNLQQIKEFDSECTIDYLDGMPDGVENYTSADSQSVGEVVDEYRPPLIACLDTPAKSSNSQAPPKFALTQIDNVVVQLPVIDMAAHEKLIEKPSKSYMQVTNHMNPNALPFEIPTIHELVQRTQVQSEVQLSNFCLKPKSVTRSEALLWKEPGLRILGSDEIDDVDLDIESLCTEGESGDAVLSEEQQAASSKPLADPNFDTTRDMFDANQINNQSRTTEDKDSLTNLATPPAVESNVNDQACVVRPRDRENTHTTAVSCEVQQNATSRSRETSQKDFLSLSNFVPAAKVSSIFHDKGFSGITCSTNLIGDFLGLRGKQFKQRLLKRQKVEELSDDPIISSQVSLCPQYHDRERTLSPVPRIDEDADAIPVIRPLPDCRSIVVNEALLQNKPLLVRFLEQQAERNLSLIYRNLGTATQPGPDLILDARTCLCIASLQALCQRPLPGQKSNTGMSCVHDHIAYLAQQYDHIIVLVHFPTSNDKISSLKLSAEQSAFVTFCNKLHPVVDKQALHVVPTWVSTSKPSSTAHIVNAWVWKFIVGKGLRTQLSSAGDCVSLQQENEELFLVKNGLNPLAARLVVDDMRRSGYLASNCVNDPEDSNRDQLLSMTAATRHAVLDDIVGERAVDRLNHNLKS